MSEGVKYPNIEELITWAKVYNGYAIGPVKNELAAAERTALDYARIDALRLAAEKEVDVLAGELEVARKRIAALEATMNRAQLFDVDATLDRGQS